MFSIDSEAIAREVNGVNPRFVLFMAGALSLSGCLGAIAPDTAVAPERPAGPPAAGGAPDTSRGPAPGAAPASGGPVAAVAPAPGRSPLRRLTRLEYDNTVHALLGDDTHPAQGFEPDTVLQGFTNNADAQNVGTKLAEEYLHAAEALSAAATRDLNRLLGCDPTGAEDRCLRSFITTFGRRAWRRPLASGEVDALAAVYVKARASEDVATSVQMVLQVLLLSPAFLYRVETGTPGTPVVGGGIPLTSWEVASRLSYLLTASMPDDELFAAAERDAVRKPQEVAAQAQRLLASPSARTRVAQFFTEWLQIDVDQMSKDTTLFPEFSPALGPLLRRDTEAFVTRVVFDAAGDLPTLLTAPYSYGPPEVARLYGVPPAAAGAGNRLDLNPDRRAGLLTQPAVLATFAKANATDPVHRGKFVRQSLLCGVIPPPPANVNIVPPKLTPGTTARQRFTEHRADPACAGCHALMDPIGLTMENYDALGKWRDTENGLPIDASGELAGTDIDGPFVGAVALARKLATSDQVATCVIRNLFRFSFGRLEAPADQGTIDALAGAWRASHRQFLSLVTAMVQGPAFLQLAPAN